MSVNLKIKIQNSYFLNDEYNEMIFITHCWLHIMAIGLLYHTSIHILPKFFSNDMLFVYINDSSAQHRVARVCKWYVYISSIDVDLMLSRWVLSYSRHIAT